jgi:uncharacterized protein YecE (DUF72 family)
MGKAACDIRIGTSGWHYSHWSGPFYPAELPKNKWLEFYSRHFDTVEINNTFYHQPKLQTFKNWQKQAPKNFLFTVKANRFITHIKRLKDVEEPLERFFTGAQLLKKNLGPILYQLPPSMHKDLDRLKAFLPILPEGRIAVLEFRHDSWYCEDTYKLLDKFNTGFCIHDLIGKESPRIVTGNVAYIRFHGTQGRYSGSYSKTQLRAWAKWLKEQTSRVQSIYAYFNNDVAGHAIKNAKTLKEQLCIS